MGGGAKMPHSTSFSPVTSTNVGISPKNFLTLLPHWCEIPSLYLMPVPNYWTWTKTAPQKKQFFRSNPYKIEVVITSLTEMLELTSLSKKSLKTQEKFKKIGIMYQNAIYICISWYNKICWFPLNKCWCQQILGGVSRDSYIFWNFFR